jgi:hypothetical protein
VFKATSDAILISIGYGKSSDGRMLYRFGPINQEGGERRLNVAVTRARSRIGVISSFSSADMNRPACAAPGPRYCATTSTTASQAAPTLECAPGPASNSTPSSAMSAAS